MFYLLGEALRTMNPYEFWTKKKHIYPFITIILMHCTNCLVIWKTIFCRQNIKLRTEILNFKPFWGYGERNSQTLFCDTWTALRNMFSTTANEKVKNKLQESLKSYLEEAGRKQELYTDFWEHVGLNINGNMIHCAFEFLEKVLLPKLCRQTGIFSF